MSLEIECVFFNAYETIVLLATTHRTSHVASVPAVFAKYLSTKVYYIIVRETIIDDVDVYC
jgi:cephalosporin hydroxylase